MGGAVPATGPVRSLNCDYSQCQTWKGVSLWAIFGFLLNIADPAQAMWQLLDNNQRQEPSAIITVTARLPGSAPKGEVTDTVNSATIKAYGADSIGDLLERMRSRVGEDASFVVNGKRLASLDAIDALPPEALAQIEVLTPSSAGRYGLTGNKAIVNLVLRTRFNFKSGEGASTAALDFKALTGSASARYSWIRTNTRVNAAFTYSLQSEVKSRGIGDDTAVAGRDAGQVYGDYSDLIPRQSLLNATFGLALPLGPVNIDWSVQAGASRTRTSANLGYKSDSPTLTSAGSSQHSSSNYARFGLTASGSLASFYLTAIGTIELGNTTLRAPSSNLLTFDGSPGENKGGISSQITKSILSSGGYGIIGTINGPIVIIPSGSVGLNVTAGATYTRLTTRLPAFSRKANANVYKTVNGHVGLDLPLFNQGKRLGVLHFSQRVDYTSIGRVGTTIGTTSSLDWTPIRKLLVVFSNSAAPSLPTADQLYGLSVSQSGTPLYDAAVGAIVPVTIISGGRDNIKNSSTSSMAAQVSYQAQILGAQTSFSVSYNRSRTSSPLISIGNPSPIAQMVLPSLFIRDGTGKLIAFDSRPFNARRQDTEQASAGVHLNNSSRNSNELSNSSSVAYDVKPSQVLSFDGSLNIAYTIRNKLDTGAGPKSIDLLTQPLSLSASAASRLSISAQASISDSDFSVNGSLSWKSGASVQPLDASLTSKTRYSPLTVIGLGGFLLVNRSGDESNPRSLRLELAVENLFDQRVRISGYRGLNGRLGNLIPNLFGRVIKFSIRSSF